jgi:hypothetical protein
MMWRVDAVSRPAATSLLFLLATWPAALVADDGKVNILYYNFLILYDIGRIDKVPITQLPVDLLEPVLWIKNVLTAILIRLSILMPIWIRIRFLFLCRCGSGFLFDADLDQVPVFFYSDSDPARPSY